MNLKMLQAYINPSIFKTYKYDKGIMNTPSDITYILYFWKNDIFEIHIFVRTIIFNINNLITVKLLVRIFN